MSSETEIEGVPVHLLDTAGLRAASDAVEQLGVERARAAAEGADIIVFVYDAQVYHELAMPLASALRAPMTQPSHKGCQLHCVPALLNVLHGRATPASSLLTCLAES